MQLGETSVLVMAGEFRDVKAAWRLTAQDVMCSIEHMKAGRLDVALRHLSQAICEVEAVLKDMRAEHDPLASHIFASRREYRAAPDTKGGKRKEVTARLSYNVACELGFHGGLPEWERLMGAMPRPYS